MKYGLLLSISSRDTFFNYGDLAQGLAIYYIYKQMGINDSDIVCLFLDQLSSYDGEPILLPVHTYFTVFYQKQSGGIGVSKKITLIFLSLTFADAMLCGGYSITELLNKQGVRECLSSSLPVGTRDIFSRELLRREGIPAYFQGCLTNTFPRREDKDYKKVLLINTPIEVLPYIPINLLNRSEALSSNVRMEANSASDFLERAISFYSYIKENAALVVSSRYHVVTPANAFGIPSIFVKKPFDVFFVDHRLDTLNPQIPVYTEEDFVDIDWYPPTPPVNQTYKTHMINLAKLRISGSTNIDEYAEKVSNYFQTSIERFRSKLENTSSGFEKRAWEYINQFAPYPTRRSYLLWGAKHVTVTENGSNYFAEYIKNTNSNLDFIGWIDSYKTGTLADKPIYTPDKFPAAENPIVFIIADSAASAAINFLNSIGYQNYVLCSNRYITSDDIKKELQNRKP